jgi:hypothetical protein
VLCSIQLVYIYFTEKCVYETLCQMYNAKLCFNFSKKFVMFDSEAAEDPTDHVVLEKTNLDSKKIFFK